MTQEQQTATRLLKSYFRAAFSAAGITWTWENDGEIEALVDCLVKSALDCVHEEGLEEEVPQATRAYYAKKAQEMK